MKVKVKITPVTGRSTNIEVELEGTGVPLSAVMKKAKLSKKGGQITVDGRPADENTHVGPDSSVVFTENAAGS
jgi:hypothetical protein